MTQAAQYQANYSSNIITMLGPNETLVTTLWTDQPDTARLVFKDSDEGYRAFIHHMNEIWRGHTMARDSSRYRPHFQL